MLDMFRRRRGNDAESDPHSDLEYSAGPPAPRRPPLPKPERINRNALTIAAVVMGTLVLAAIVFMQPSRPAQGDARTQSPVRPSPPEATFLDQPLAIDTSRVIQIPLPPTAAHADSPPKIGGESTANPYAARYAAMPPTDPRADSYRAALEAPVFAPHRSWESAKASDIEISEATVPPVVPARPGNVETAATRLSPTSAARTLASVEPAAGPFAIQAGTLIPAVLLTGVDSDLPGEVLGQVSRDVYDSRTMSALLVPKGSRILGKYEDRVAVGQNRLLIAWTRVILPDGRSIKLPGLETKDESGAGGLHDQVDRHTRQVFGTATLLSLISAGVQLSQPRGSISPFGLYASAGEVAAGAVGRELADVATQMLRRDIDVRPTIRIRQGMPFNVYLNTDLAFTEPYLAQR